MLFIKFGKEEHLSNLKERGEIFFNPCKVFRELELKQMQKGIGDTDDGGISAVYEKIAIKTADGRVIKLEDRKASFIVEPCLNTPTFCLRKSDSFYITAEYREKLHVQFPDYTHALVIENEVDFLENIRYKFKSHAFAHSVFYADDFFTDFIEFLGHDQSDVKFYEPKTSKKKAKYYMSIEVVFDSGIEVTRRVDDSNFYKTMFRKNLFFEDQSEYRIVLPYIKFESGQLLQVSPVQESNIYSIDSLVR